MATYPKRESHFAHKFGRVIFRCCLANEIGADTCYLLLQIAHTEDSARYRGPVTFFNEQLVSVCGCANVKALARLRQKAIEAGWLDYQPGGKGTAGRYFVTIPDSHKSVGDGSCESDLHPAFLVEIDQANELTRAKSTKEVGKEAGEKRDTSGQRTGKQVGNIHPSPIPNPIPKEIPPASPATPIDSDFEAWWKSYPRREGKKKTKAFYETAIKGIALARNLDRTAAVAWLLEITKAFAASPKGRSGEFCPHSMTWLNQGRYDDDPKAWEEKGGSKSRHNTGGPIEGRERAI